MNELYAAFDKITAAVTEARAVAVHLGLPDPQATRVECEVCGVPLAGVRALAEHLANVHDTPEG